MRLVGFERDGQARLGVVEGDTVIDLQALAPEFPADLAEILRRPELGLEAISRLARGATERHRIAREGLIFGLPVRKPGKILCLGLNYHDHAKEGGNKVADYPAIFLRTLSSLVPHGQPIVAPRVSDNLDYEAEMVAVVGKRARHVARADALSVIAGYTCFNDSSVRDWQRHTTQWTLGKNFDATGGFGPEFVSADELPPGAAGLRICSRLNGRVMQDDNTTNMVFPVDRTVEIVTQAMTLEPGDLLVMGTPAGVGYARTPPVFMQPGDTVEIEIERIGTLVNPIAAEGA
jgi:2-keto-4-pentenoate hydratase/2-oxohepta-3-ene-1,7-dioic acid hydratase in catechol pathway